MRSISGPYYLLEESALRRNLQLIKRIATEADVEFILAFKAFALWKTFPIFREYIRATTASSPYEARLGFEEFGAPCHTYSPAYEEATFPEIVRCSSHITFNSLTQYERFAHCAAATAKPELSFGLRINPEYSEIETELYNPCAPGSRFGVLAEQLPDRLPEGLEGFHCHNHCESSSHALERSLHHVEQKFGRWLPQLKWLNLGGGHLVTRKDYDVSHLISTLKAFREKFPNLHLVLEPGSAFAWQTGSLVSQVVDIVENHGIKTALLNVSFTCHIPDCLEMPYHPQVRGAETIAANGSESCDTFAQDSTTYRLGGNSCLSGDYMGFWRFPAPLRVGDEVVFEDMIHYTTVKTTMFNGIQHPALVIRHLDGTQEVLRQYTYDDYKARMD